MIALFERLLGRWWIEEGKRPTPRRVCPVEPEEDTPREACMFDGATEESRFHECEHGACSINETKTDEDSLSVRSVDLLSSSDDDKDSSCSNVGVWGEMNYSCQNILLEQHSSVAVSPILRWSVQGSKTDGDFGEVTLVYPQSIVHSDLQARAIDGLGFPIKGNYEYCIRTLRPLTRVVDVDNVDVVRVSYGSILPPGVYPLHCLFAPRDTKRFHSVESRVATLVVLKGTCTVTYSVPLDPLVAGTPLSDEYFCASVKPFPTLESSFFGHKEDSTTRRQIELTSGDVPGVDAVPGRFYYSHVEGTKLTKGIHLLRVKFDPQDKHLWNYSYASIEVQVIAPRPSAHWTRPTSMQFGERLSNLQLRAVCDEPPPVGFCSLHSRRCCKICFLQSNLVCANVVEEQWNGHGSWSYSPGEGSLLSVGTHTLQAIFTPHDPERFSSLELSTSIVILKAVPRLFWEPPAILYEGEPLERRTFSACTDPLVNGVFDYDPLDGALLPLGKHTLRAHFSPVDTDSFLDVTAERTVSVAPKKLVQIFWSAPKPLVYPEPLTRGQLNASLSTLNARGQLSYNPSLGTVLPAGRHELTVYFKSESMAFKNSSHSVFILVELGVPRLFWPALQPILEGEILQDLQLSVHCQNVPASGSFVYDPPIHTQLLLGKHTLRCTFHPSEQDVKNWNSASIETIIEVLRRQRRPTTLIWDEPAPITHPSHLSRQQCNARCKECDGDFRYIPNLGTILDVGTHNLRVKFQPSESFKYAPSEALVQLVVLKGVAVLSWIAVRTLICYGEPIGADMLCATSDAAGEISYNPPIGTVLDAGIYTLSVTLRPFNRANFDPANSTAPLHVTRHTPMLTWDSIEDLVYPTPLPAEYLLPRLCFPLRGDLSPAHPLYAEGPGANLPLYPKIAEAGMRKGNFIFSHKEGQVLPAGKHRLCCRYIPDDLVNFFSCDISIWLTVKKGVPTVFSWRSQAKLLYGSPLTSEQHLNAVFDMDETLLDVTYDPPAGHIFDSVGDKVLSLIVQPKDLKNFDPVQQTQKLVVDRLAAPLQWLAPHSIVYGTELTRRELCASLDRSKLTDAEISDLIGGHFIYSPPERTILDASDQALLTAIYQPPHSCKNFKQSFPIRVLLCVDRAEPKLLCKPVKAITYGEPLSPKHINPSVNGPFPGNFTYSVAIGTVLPPGSHRIVIDFLPFNSSNTSSCSTFLYLDVYRAFPVLEWPAFSAPRTEKSGFLLSMKNLDCMARGISQKKKVEGAFYYTPPLGTRLIGTGVRELRCDFVLAAEATKFYSPAPPIFVKVRLV